MRHTSLRTGNDIMALEDGWETVLLDWSRDFISSHLDVLQHDRMQASFFKFSAWFETNGAFLDNLQARDTGTD